MGEILGCGLPVVANSGVGDVARIVEKYRVGILVSEGSEQAMTHAIDQLEELRKDPELPARCRRAAEEVFSLESGTAAYDALYSKLVRS
jgi:glycosyltransferase involved in cell wall biosynthesis